MTLPAPQTATANHPDHDQLDRQLATERAHLDASRAALRRMRERAEALYSSGHTVAGDPFAAETLGVTLARRVAELADDPSTPLFFGRLDFGSDHGNGAAYHAGKSYHIGRRHVIDDAGEPMVLDWRAPVSRAFYRASARDPQGVRLRRRFGFGATVATGREAPQALLTSFEDERLDRGEELGTASRILTAEIERPRVGPMRDIVATIQPEQDELVRADLAESICVQGAPGTGKTAVGLHRAAYLLYLHRERLRRSGVLIVGPNRAFMSYISGVLPALGEVDVAQATIGEVIARAPVHGAEDPATAALKHDPRMAAVLRRAIHGYIGKADEPIVVSDGSYRWRISADALRRVVDEARREDLPYATGRERVRARVVSLLQRQAEARRAESPSDAWLRRMGRSRPVTDFLDRVWPALTPEGLVFALLSDRERLAAAADDLLTADEQRLLRWAKPPRSVKATRWTDSDAVLLDEAAGLIERLPSFGHVVVDEAQDLSPMQCRAIARRSEHASLTLLGDLAQGTTPWAAATWQETLTHLGKPDATVLPLTVGFRVPAAVLAFANRLLPALAVTVPPAESLRRDGNLQVRQVAEVESAAVAEVRAALAHDGSIAVIAEDAAAGGLQAALRSAGIEALALDEGGAAARVTVVPATLVKGLEYDHVVVVEPARIVAAEPRGLNRLYVVLTRAVSRLAVVHAQPLPTPL